MGESRRFSLNANEATCPIKVLSPDVIQHYLSKSYLPVRTTIPYPSPLTARVPLKVKFGDSSEFLSELPFDNQAYPQDAAVAQLPQ
jgi:hypothetical protein